MKAAWTERSLNPSEKIQKQAQGCERMLHAALMMLAHGQPSEETIAITTPVWVTPRKILSSEKFKRNHKLNQSRYVKSLILSCESVIG